MPTPNPAPNAGGHDSLDGVTCVSATDCWTVGEYGTFSGQHRTLAAHDGVACGSPTSCLAVGRYWDYKVGMRYSIALHWDGTSWSNG